MEHYITLAELTQIGIFLVSLVSLLYAIFHNNEKRKYDSPFPSPHLKFAESEKLNN